MIQTQSSSILYIVRVIICVYYHNYAVCMVCHCILGYCNVICVNWLGLVEINVCIVRTNSRLIEPGVVVGKHI